MASIISVSQITGSPLNPNYVQLPSGVVDGTTLTFTTVNNQQVLSVALGSLSLQYFTPTVQTIINSNVAIVSGMVVKQYGNENTPGWLPCDGSAQSRVLYPNLFAQIGIQFGSGDGVTTFNLPADGYPWVIKT